MLGVVLDVDLLVEGDAVELVQVLVAVLDVDVLAVVDTVLLVEELVVKLVL